MDVSIAALFGSGLKLMVIGMGTVFFFLMLLVGVIDLTYRVMKRFANPDSAHGPSAKPAGDPSASEDRELVAVITAAIHRYEQS
ncbi:MAG: OadG family protein [Methylotetracoccus sp.]|jgi:oxaloacetate decarboxylase gamma subunit|nr:OadG family protein [Methylotetracoccus sp.]